jgi:hypothetical protein
VDSAPVDSGLDSGVGGAGLAAGRRTATPVLRSRALGGRDEAARDETRVGLARACARRRTATSRSTSPRLDRPSHETHSIATTVAATGGASHHRICTCSG